MIDRFGRKIDYLRVSVTDRCNLRCRYCMPADGVAPRSRHDLLTFEEIAEVVQAAVAVGIGKVRLTGGEPLLRRNIETLVSMLARMPGVGDLAMTTNGTLLAVHAAPLAAAGLQRVNVSLDALDPVRYAELTRGGDVRRVLSGIDAARRAGLAPIRLNCVSNGEASRGDAADVARYAAAQGLEVRFIRQMDLAAGVFAPVEGGTGGACPRCNRLRLSSDGTIHPCLFSDLGFSVRGLGAAEAIRQAVSAKPQEGARCTSRLMYAIGG